MDRQTPNTFAALLREMRQRLFHKQLALAVAVGCTEAAVSYWETGKRAPNQEKLPGILTALTQAGAETEAIRHLLSAWNRAHDGDGLGRARRGREKGKPPLNDSDRSARLLAA